MLDGTQVEVCILEEFAFCFQIIPDHVDAWLEYCFQADHYPPCLFLYILYSLGMGINSEFSISSLRREEGVKLFTC